MALTSIEWIAVVVAVLTIVKILVILINKKIWYEKVSLPVLKHVRAAVFVFVVLAVLVFFYLIESMTIVQIFAVIAFSSLLMGMVFAAYFKSLESFVKKVYKSKFNAWMWLYMLIWLVLSVWVLYEVFLG